MVNVMSSAEPRFMEAFPYQASVLALPVTDIDAAARWYSRCFGMVEAERRSDPVPTVVMERDGTRIGFSVNGGDPSEDGAAFLSRVSVPFEVNSRRVVSTSASGAWTSAKAGSSGRSLSSHRMASATTFTSRSSGHFLT